MTTQDYNEIIRQLTSTLTVSNHGWDSYELDFLRKLKGKTWDNLTKKQKKFVNNLWEKI